MPKLYYYHIQLTENSNWIREIGTSLTNVLANIATIDTIPYSYFKTDFE